MPQRKSAKEELRKSQKRRKRNLLVKKEIKKAIKSFKKAVESNDWESAKKLLNTGYKVLDKASSKKIIHKNKANRQKSRLAKILNKPIQKPIENKEQTPPSSTNP
ncbi:MAG: 30S ribosomal protein S20 [Candidatus Omnitrophica bacterium]|nr:30S ribosomal protein S20 [Candidatus Omnitrophota bacterium]MCM8826640.1 30S ribosomal protein S20 [Candidatus Omnitrophota bacterium]